MNDNKVQTTGIGFNGLLTLVFIVLKLLGKITWSWWWVLSPIWISAIFWIVVILVCYLIVRLDKRHKIKR